MAVTEIPTLALETALATDGPLPQFSKHAGETASTVVDGYDSPDIIVGFDEVGRGSLAGPVMVGAAAIRAADLPVLDVPAGVADSKMLTEKRRESIYDELENWAAAYAVGSSTSAEIDEWGISHALGIAALRALAAVETLLLCPDFEGIAVPAEAAVEDILARPVIVAGRGADAASDRHDPVIGSRERDTQQETEESFHSRDENRPLRILGILDGPSDYISKAIYTFDAPDLPVVPRMTTQVKGDRHCATIATAAVIAKVTRDRLMEQLGDLPAYAPYRWRDNKGYGSQAHRDAIRDHGVTPFHRTSWKLLKD
ncbi:ribonuclease HII [Bifidobacterium choloepi]|uniref:Ribonuclease n=1 Tax=Bifidobacterium choloepi TaxID=2614131 RepID=A0A6I5N0T8_9BIFI|nr:ribonuclease HII [Bifidobacterium choloepi]NEG69745.1 ribonuclease HII [Bifidobacterium choloepi]